MIKWYIRCKIRKLIKEHMQNASCTTYHIDHYHMGGDITQPLYDKVEWELRYIDRLEKLLIKYV